MCRSARQSCRLGLTFGQQQRPCKTVGPWRPCGAAVFVPIFTKNFRPSRHALPVRPAVTRIRDHATPVMLAVSTYKFTFRRFSTSKRTRDNSRRFSTEHLPPVVTEQTARGNVGYSLRVAYTRYVGGARREGRQQQTARMANELYSNAGIASIGLACVTEGESKKLRPSSRVTPSAALVSGPISIGYLASVTEGV